MELVQLNPQQFERFSDFIYGKSGIRIPENKLTLLSNRIRKRLKAGDWPDFDAYYDHLTSLRGARELDYFFDAVTTNETSFFRTPTHFDWFGGPFLEDLVTATRLGKRPRSLRTWSAGCASGAEAYTMAICLRENAYRLRDWELSILGTDISEAALEMARDGVFGDRAMENVSEKRRKRFFRPVEADRWKVRTEVAAPVTFERQNLLRAAPSPPYDCIFIRNVLIYFDEASKRRAVKHLVDALAPGGFLVVGPSEGIYAMLDPLKRHSAFLYEKVAS